LSFNATDRAGEHSIALSGCAEDTSAPSAADPARDRGPKRLRPCLAAAAPTPPHRRVWIPDQRHRRRWCRITRRALGLALPARRSSHSPHHRPPATAPSPAEPADATRSATATRLATLLV